MNTEIVLDHPQMIKYIDYLQRKNAEQLSFYPLSVFEREKEKGRLFLELLNGEPCGYIYRGSNAPDIKCHQVCIQYDARRREHGSTLVDALERHATSIGASSVTLRCGFDLEANDFWRSLGYKCVGLQDGGARRMRTINVWRKQINPELFEIPEIQSANGSVDSSIWRKNKPSGNVSQFLRGELMRNYRNMLIRNRR